MRRIKFRTFYEKMHYYDLADYCNADILGFDGDDNTLMQFTGLKDKNGKDIYEGDIVTKYYTNLSLEDTSKYEAVSFTNLSDSDGYNASTYLCWSANDCSLADLAGKCEIIGNIYENPELLQK